MAAWHKTSLFTAVYWAIGYTTRSTSTAQKASGQVCMLIKQQRPVLGSAPRMLDEAEQYVVAGSGPGGVGRLRVGGVAEGHRWVAVAHTDFWRAHPHTTGLSLYLSISLQEYTSHSSIREKGRRDTSARPHIAARTRAELGSRLTQPRRSPHALGSAAQQCAGAPQWSDGGGWTRFCEQ